MGQMFCQNKMIQSSQYSSQEYQYFSNPEILQEIRQNLVPFANYQEELHRDLITSFSQRATQFIFKSLNVGQEQAQKISSGLQDMVLGVVEEVGQKSSNLASVASLSIKMIDFITQQSANYYQSIEDYQLQVDRLQNMVHDLNNKNNIIESDVEIFKEQLEAARNELDQITEQKQDKIEDAESQPQDLLQSLRQSRIQSLQVELERMRAQLSYYKASGLSRGSLKCEDIAFKNNIQTKSLFYLNQEEPYMESQYQENTLARYSQKNKELLQENQKLRLQVSNFRNRCSRQSLAIEQKIMARSKSLAKVKTFKNITPNNHSSFFDFAEFFTLLKGKQQQKLQNICQEREAELEQLQTERKSIEQKGKIQDENTENARHLRSQWSRCSLGEFPHLQMYQSPQLIYLTQESMENPNGQTSNDYLFDCSPTKISISRETQASTCSPSGFESVGINTVRESEMVQEKKDGWMKRMLKGLVCNSYIDRVKDMIVTRRIRQKGKSVNRGALPVYK